MKVTKKFTLPESEIPTQWYNIVADMPNKPQPLLHPGTRKPIKAEDMEGLFAKELAKQEFSTERWHEIPEDVRTLYKIYRPSPLVRASGLEKALNTPAKIYFKNESVSPVGSHKLNTAIAQCYYNAEQGITHLTTETGAGQWGSAMAVAARHFKVGLDVFMVKNSYNTKPYRKIVMRTYGANVHAVPSPDTEYGRAVLAKDPTCLGSLGMAISEAVEMAVHSDNARYTLGSVLNHVLLHQTVIGLEAEKQMEMTGDYPDKVIACFGGGSNFSGISFPFLRHNFLDGKKTRFMAAEPAACPKLSCGKFEYDFGDTEGLTPLIPMYTLGHDFQPAQIHAAGLRYHGGGQIVSQLKKDGLIESYPIDQRETFAAGITFAQSEGIIPAPESTHAIALVIREALKDKAEGRDETILFNLSGHGLLDMAAYEQYMDGKL
ncbi:MAG: TrpB-like pyridoxal phosphate-dependent enzyme [Bacteroidales bacterium]|nr:TrpB-like pyridoxal phosphate-dependent enzyme [Bacteroidales bacterium]MDD4421335.1 TrpB-like pyridoxal phosphate-dependent enzyme [Bacteroidales bacterium]